MATGSGWVTRSGVRLASTMAGKPPATRKPAQQVISRTQTVMHHGPLPDPQTLAQYESLQPGMLERIVSMAEADQRHRIASEVAELQANIEHRASLQNLQADNAKAMFRSDMVGQVLGGSVALLALGAAIYSVYAGSPWYLTVAFVGLPVAAIIKAIREKNK